MTCYSEKELTSPIYLVKLLVWVIHYAKIEFSTKNVFFVFPYLEQIFGET